LSNSIPPAVGERVWRVSKMRLLTTTKIRNSTQTTVTALLTRPIAPFGLTWSAPLFGAAAA